LEEFNKRVDVLIVSTGCGSLASAMCLAVSIGFLNRGSYE